MSLSIKMFPQDRGIRNLLMFEVNPEFPCPIELDYYLYQNS